MSRTELLRRLATSQPRHSRPSPARPMSVVRVSDAADDLARFDRFRAAIVRRMRVTLLAQIRALFTFRAA